LSFSRMTTGKSGNQARKRSNDTDEPSLSLPQTNQKAVETNKSISFKESFRYQKIPWAVLGAVSK